MCVTWFGPTVDLKHKEFGAEHRAELEACLPHAPSLTPAAGKLGVVTYACCPSTQEAKTEASKVQYYSQKNNKPAWDMGYSKTLSQKKKKKM